MPAIYTHRRFGQEVLARLPESEKSIVENYRELYDIGLHGPDILFYYHPLSRNSVNLTGSRTHSQPGKIWFAQMWRVARQRAYPEPYLAYLYGFLCHFFLDSACHGYINETARTSPCSHNQIETELDRYYMIADGRDPMSYSPTGHIHPTEENARIISAFFPRITEQEIRECLKTMVKLENIWVASNPVKRGAVVGILKATRLYDDKKDFMRPYEAPEDCVALLPPILEMYDRAVPRAVRMIPAFQGMAKGEEPWASCFSLSFDPQCTSEAPED